MSENIKTLISHNGPHISGINIVIISESLPFPIGLAQASYCGEDPNILYFNRLYVRPEYRQKGHATKLLTMLLESIKENNITLHMDINPYGDMDYSQLEQFYLKNGFQKYTINDKIFGEYHTYYFNKTEEQLL